MATPKSAPKTMSDTTPLAAAQNKLWPLINAIAKSDPPLLQRIQTYIVKRCGQKLTEFMQNGASPEEKMAVLTDLTEIIEGKQWDKLPPIAGGQATGPAAPAPKKAPAPAPVEPQFEIEPEPPAVMLDRAAIAVNQGPLSPHVDPLTLAVRHLVQQEVKAALADSDGLSVDMQAEVRTFARAELADALEKIARALRS